MKNTHPLVTQLLITLEATANPDIARAQSKYMKNRFPFLGIPGPKRKEVLKVALKLKPILSTDELHAVITELWNAYPRESQYCALEIAHKYKNLWTEETFILFENCVITKSWWDSVDALASNCIGPLLQKYPELLEHMDSWIMDTNLWKRRVALLFQLKYKQSTDSKRLFKYILICMYEKDFFIRKAIGWILREYSKTNASAVRDFLEQHNKNLSRLSVSEGSKYL